MSTRREGNPLTKSSIKPSKLDESPDPAIGAGESNDVIEKLAATEKQSSPTQDVESFFDMVVEELSA